MLLDVVAPLAAGLGLFFVGVTLVSSNLKRMTSRKLRLFFSRFTRHDWQSSALGLFSGFVTQSSSISAFIVAGLTESGLMTVRRALPVIFWANAGCALLVLVAVFDIHYVVFALLFLTGLGYAFDMPKRSRHLVRALFGIGLLFYGLQMITASAAPLAQADWVRQLLADTHGSTLMALGLGIVLTLITQTALGIMLVAIALIKSGLFTVDQTMMIIYGAHLGSSVLTWLLASGVRGTPKQLVMSQVLFNCFGVLVMLGLFYLETLGGVPLVKALLARLSPLVDTQMALLIILFNWAVPILLTPVLGPVERLLGRIWPPTRQEALTKIQFIHDHALDVPEAAMVLVDKELARLFRRLPRYAEDARRLLSGCPSEDLDALHTSFGALMDEIRGVLADLVRQGGEGPGGEELVRLGSVADLTTSLEETVHRFSGLAGQASRLPAGRSFFETLLESLDFLLVTAASAVDGDQEDRHILETATRDQSRVLKDMRDRYLGLAADLRYEDKALAHGASGLFERAAWLLNRLAGLMPGGNLAAAGARA